MQPEAELLKHQGLGSVAHQKEVERQRSAALLRVLTPQLLLFFGPAGG